MRVYSACPITHLHIQVHAFITAEFRSCVKVEVAVLGSPSLIVLTVSVDVRQH